MSKTLSAKSMCSIEHPHIGRTKALPYSTPINRSLSSVKVFICSKIIVYLIIHSDFVKAALAVRHSLSLFLICTLASTITFIFNTCLTVVLG